MTSKVEGACVRPPYLRPSDKAQLDFGGREYRRADLGVLMVMGNEADRARYLGYMAKDAHKMTTVPTSDHFLLLMVLDVRADVPSEPAGVAKYAAHINWYAKAHPDGGVRAAARERWLEGLATGFNALTTLYPFEAGRVWGLDISVDCFLGRPLRAPSPFGVHQLVQERAPRCAHPGMDLITYP